MSLSMWEMYGGGSESVAVRSTSDKLESVPQRNTALLDKHGLMGMLAEVEYVEGLKHPDYKVQEHIYQIMFERERDINVGLFAIKPAFMNSSMKYEQYSFQSVSCLPQLSSPSEYKWIFSST